MQKRLCAMGKGLNDRLLQRPGIRLQPAGATEPVAASRHEFQHPEGGTLFDASGKCIGEGIHPGIAQAGIVIKGIAVQGFGAFIIVYAVGSKAGGIGGHRTAGILPQDSCLAILELDLAVAGKPFEIQAYQRIFIKGVYQILRTGLYGIDRRGNLVKALIFLGPEYGAASLVKIFYCTVFLFQPAAEFLTAHRAGTSAGPLLGGFVIDLKTGYPGVLSVMLRYFLRDPRAGFPVKIIVIAIVASSSEGPYHSSVILIQDFRVSGHQPGRRAGCGGTDDGTDPRLPQAFHHIIQPAECKMPFLRLHTAPCKFPHAHRIDSGFFNQGKVLFQFFLRFLFRIIGNSI